MFDRRTQPKYNAQRVYRRTLGSWEPEITGLAELHGLTVYRCGNRIRTHNPEVTGSLTFVRTGESSPRYLRGARKGAFLFWARDPTSLGLTRLHQPRERHSSPIGHLPYTPHAATMYTA
jgi:hypothetical protein